MRINRLVALATGLSRRAADSAIAEGRVLVNHKPASPGTDVTEKDTVTLDGSPIALPSHTVTIMLNKPTGYVSSRNGQGSKTIYDLLPPRYHKLKPIGRLDKDSSGLLLLTNDGELANLLTHPRYRKEKVYEVVLDRALSVSDKAKIEGGVMLQDGPSVLRVSRCHIQGSQGGQGNPTYTVRLSEGRNRQIRRTFESVGYQVTKLHRTQFGGYIIGKLHPGDWQEA